MNILAFGVEQRNVAYAFTELNDPDDQLDRPGEARRAAAYDWFAYGETAMLPMP